MTLSRGSIRTPPVGKSGPGMNSTNFSIVALGCLMRRSNGEQMWERRRHHHRLVTLAVISGAEIDRVLVDALQQQLGDSGQPRLGVAHRRRVIAVDIAEIALAVDERVTNGEFLR